MSCSRGCSGSAAKSLVPGQDWTASNHSAKILFAALCLPWLTFSVVFFCRPITYWNNSPSSSSFQHTSLVFACWRKAKQIFFQDLLHWGSFGVGLNATLVSLLRARRLGRQPAKALHSPSLTFSCANNMSTFSTTMVNVCDGQLAVTSKKEVLKPCLPSKPEYPFPVYLVPGPLATKTDDEEGKKVDDTGTLLLTSQFRDPRS